jgi:hypothetical protein
MKDSTNQPSAGNETSANLVKRTAEFFNRIAIDGMQDTYELIEYKRKSKSACNAQLAMMVTGFASVVSIFMGALPIAALSGIAWAISAVIVKRFDKYKERYVADGKLRCQQITEMHARYLITFLNAEKAFLRKLPNSDIQIGRVKHINGMGFFTSLFTFTAEEFEGLMNSAPELSLGSLTWFND